MSLFPLYPFFLVCRHGNRRTQAGGKRADQLQRGKYSTAAGGAGMEVAATLEEGEA